MIQLIVIAYSCANSIAHGGGHVPPLLLMAVHGAP